MDSVYLYDRWYGHIPSAGWDEVTSQTEWVCDHWDQPDEGIGETRGAPRKFLYSRLMCWVAIETGDPAGHPPGPCPPTWNAGGRPAMRSTGGSWTAAGHQP
jgi:hypothetical protein